MTRVQLVIFTIQIFVDSQLGSLTTRSIASTILIKYLKCFDPKIFVILKHGHRSRVDLLHTRHSKNQCLRLVISANSPFGFL